MSLSSGNFLGYHYLYFAYLLHTKRILFIRLIDVYLGIEAEQIYLKLHAANWIVFLRIPSFQMVALRTDIQRRSTTS